VPDRIFTNGQPARALGSIDTPVDAAAPTVYSESSQYNGTNVDPSALTANVTSAVVHDDGN